MLPSYHIGFREVSEAKYAILPGDPGRVESIAEHLDNARFLNQNREYTAWLGELESQSVLVMSTGMGGPSTAIAVEELAEVGIKTFVRVGTCGGMADHVRSGDLVIATAAIRQEGTSKEYIPIEFPAVADFDVTNALVEAAKKLVSNTGDNPFGSGAVSAPGYHAGVVHCKDSFYGQHSPDRMPVGFELQNKWDAWLRAGCLASEMESAALFIVAQTLGLKAGCVLHVVWNQIRAAKGLYGQESHDTGLAVKAAVEAIRLLIKAEGK